MHPWILIASISFFYRFRHQIREIRQLHCQKIPVFDTEEAAAKLIGHLHITLVIYWHQLSYDLAIQTRSLAYVKMTTGTYSQLLHIRFGVLVHRLKSYIKSEVQSMLKLLTQSAQCGELF
jgi:hypothetical protein